jgi:hypothetical protein
LIENIGRIREQAAPTVMGVFVAAVERVGFPGAKLGVAVGVNEIENLDDMIE